MDIFTRRDVRAEAMARLEAQNREYRAIIAQVRALVIDGGSLCAPCEHDVREALEAK